MTWALVLREELPGSLVPIVCGEAAFSMLHNEASSRSEVLTGRSSVDETLALRVLGALMIVKGNIGPGGNELFTELISFA